MGNLKIFKKSTLIKIREEFKNNKKLFFWIFLFVLFAAMSFELFNRPFGNVRNIKIPFDDKIPFIKELILVYHSFAPFMIITGLLLLIDNQDEYKKYVIALFVAQIAAYIIYMNFQTFVPRYDTDLLGNDIFSKLIKLTYTVDNSYSGAPSLHVCNMTIGIIYFSRSNYSTMSKLVFNSYLALIAITTVLVKQHVVLDIPAGILHAIVFYLLVEYFYKKYKRN